MTLNIADVLSTNFNFIINLIKLKCNLNIFDDCKNAESAEMQMTWL